MVQDGHTLVSPILSEAFLDALPQVFCCFHCAEQSIRFDYVSRAVSDWTGIASEAYVAEGRDWLRQVHPSDRRLLLAAIEDAAGKNG